MEKRSSQNLCACKPYRLCSNRAATRVNLLKSPEKHKRRNTAICSYFANPGMVQQSIVPSSHGGGHEFESRRVHPESSPNTRKNEARDPSIGVVVQQPCSTVRTVDLSILHLGSPDLLDEYVSEGQSARKLDLEEAKEAEEWHALSADLEFVIQTTRAVAQILYHHEYPNVQEDASGITTIRPSAEHVDNQLLTRCL